MEVYAAVRRFVFIEGNSRRNAARVFGLSCAAGKKRSTIYSMSCSKRVDSLETAKAVIFVDLSLPRSPAFDNRGAPSFCARALGKHRASEPALCKKTIPH